MLIQPLFKILGHKSEKVAKTHEALLERRVTTGKQEGDQMTKIPYVQKRTKNQEDRIELRRFIAVSFL